MLPSFIKRHPPLKYLVLGWLVIFAGFLLGPASFRWLGFVTVFYLGVAVTTVVLGFLLGFSVGRGSCRAPLPAPTAALGLLNWPLLIGSAVSAAGSAYAFLLLSRAGRTIQDSIEMTGTVRQTQASELGMAGTVANLFGFMSVSWLVIAMLMLRYRGGLRVASNVISLFFSSIGVLFLLLTYIANVNRTAFLMLFLLIVFFVPVFDRGDFRGAVRRMGAAGLSAVAALVVFLFSYILFIAVKRSGGDSDNAMFTDAFIRTRYELPGVFAQGGIADGLYKLQWYASHQLSNLDLLLTGGQVEWVRFEPAHVFFWLYQQASRLAPDLAFQVSEVQFEGAAIAENSGGFAWQWYTGFASFILGFGILGSILVIFIFSLMMGFFQARYVFKGSVVAGLCSLWLITMAFLMMIYMPIDNFVHSNLFYVFCANGLALLMGRKSI